MIPQTEGLLHKKSRRAATTTTTAATTTAATEAATTASTTAATVAALGRNKTNTNKINSFLSSLSRQRCENGSLI